VHADGRFVNRTGDCFYPVKGEIYYFSGYYSVGYLLNAEVLPQQQKADNIFNE